MRMARTILIYLSAGSLLIATGCSGDADPESNALVAENQNQEESQGDNQQEEEEEEEEEEEPAEPSGNEVDQEMLFVCLDDMGFSEARVRRINRSEWTRNTGHAAGSVADKNPFDALGTNLYTTYSEGETINDSILDIYLDSAGSGSYGWATRDRYRAGALSSNVNDDSLGCMFNEDQRPDEECVENYTAVFLERGALFRPPTDEEHQALIDFAENALDSEESGEEGARRHTLKRIFSAAWMTSGALFRTEHGVGEADEYGRRRLGDWELANAIAYALDGRAAGAPGVYARHGLAWSADFEGHLPILRQAAIDQTLSSDPEIIAEAVRAYFGGLDDTRRDLNLDVSDERRISRRGEYWMANGVRDFFREWLGYDKHINIFKDTASATSAFGSEMHSDYGNLISGYYGHESRLVEQMDDMIARIVADDEDVFHNLLTSRTFYVPATAPFVDSSINNSTLRTTYVYNITELIEATREDRWKVLPEDERAGVLTHPAYLASHSGAFENDPNIVHRGKHIREHLLCENVPDLPITVEAAFDPDTRDQSARQRMSEQVDGRNECAGCHAQMNPLGYPFEIYNHAGLLREEDHGAPPDGSSELQFMPSPELNGPVRDAVEMSERFADSPYVKRCFLRQIFRYFMGRDEVARDACTLTQMEQAYEDSGGSFAEVLIALFQSDSFQYRVITE